MQTVTLASWFPYINEFVTCVGIGLMGYLVYRADGWLKVHASFLSAQTRTLIESSFSSALQEGFAIAQTKLTDEEKKGLAIPVNDWLTKVAAQYAIDKVPAYLSNFLGGKTPDEAVQLAAAKLLATLPKDAAK